MASSSKQPIALISMGREVGSEVNGGSSVITVSSVHWLSEALAKLGWQVDVFARKTASSQPKIAPHSSGYRTIHLEAGPTKPLPPSQVLNHLPKFVESFQTFQTKEGNYPLVHTLDWLSGQVGAQLKAHSGIQLVHTQSNYSLIEQNVLQKADQLVQMVMGDGVQISSSTALSQREAKRRLGIHSQSRLILAVGSSYLLSEIEMLLAAIERCKATVNPFAAFSASAPALHLAIVEEDPTDSVRSLVEPLLQSVDFGQLITVVNAAATSLTSLYVQAADVCVAPNAYIPFSSTALEAVSAGVPVIASAASGLRFAIVPEETGLLVPPNQSDAYATAIHRVLFDELWTKRWEYQQSNAVKCGAGWAKSAAHLSDLYRRLLAQTLCPQLVGQLGNPYVLQLPGEPAIAPKVQSKPVPSEPIMAKPTTVKVS